MRSLIDRLARRRRQGNRLDSVTGAALAPLSRAQRCLDQWLREEDRHLSPRQRQRAAALIARYFEHEDDADDALILSFLRHYGGMGLVDLDDPQAVRLELKTVLDRSISTPARHSRLRLWVSVATGMVTMAVVLVTLYLSQQTLSPAQQAELRMVVAETAAARSVAPATVWAGIKRDIGVTRYQDIRRWDFTRAMAAAGKGG